MLLFTLFFCGFVFSKTLKFDDVSIIGNPSYRALPRPYDGFIFKRINTPYTGYIDDNIPVLNVTNFDINTNYTFYNNAVVSQPNIIFTTGENLCIYRPCRCNFRVTKLYMTSIFINNMSVVIKGYKNNKVLNTKVVNLMLSTQTEIILGWKNINNITIGCSNPEYATCAHIGYDNIEFL